MTNSLTPVAASVSNFEQLLAAVRALRPKCPECGHALDPEGEGVRVRHTDMGATERVCRPCFHAEIAEMQMAHSMR